MISRTAQYAIRALVYLATADREANITAGSIAEATGVPSNYLTKLLNTLTHEGILASVRGPHGGFHLARPPSRVTLASVFGAFQEVDLEICLLGNLCHFQMTECRSRTRCRALSTAVKRFIETTSIADLAGTIRWTGPPGEGEEPAAVPTVAEHRDPHQRRK